MKRQHGFTLIELMIVMVIITILAGIGLAVYGNSVKSAKEATLREDLFQMRDAIDKYYADKNHYPASLDALVEEKYIRAVPVDPMTKSLESWQLIPAEPDPNNPSADIGIYNVKSGSEEQAIDGSKYADW